MSRTSKRSKWISKVKSKAKPLSQFKVDSALKIAKTFHNSLDLFRRESHIHLFIPQVQYVTLYNYFHKLLKYTLEPSWHEISLMDKRTGPRLGSRACRFICSFPCILFLQWKLCWKICIKKTSWVSKVSCCKDIMIRKLEFMVSVQFFSQFFYYIYLCKICKI